MNIPVVPSTSDTAYEFILKSIFIPLAEEFSPRPDSDGKRESY